MSEPDGELDARVAEARAGCPYLIEREPVEGLDDAMTCSYDMEPCGRRKACPVGKW